MFAILLTILMFVGFVDLNHNGLMDESETCTATDYAIAIIPHDAPARIVHVYIPAGEWFAMEYDPENSYVAMSRCTAGIPVQVAGAASSVQIWVPSECPATIFLPIVGGERMISAICEPKEEC